MVDVVVYLPVSFMSGNIGRLFREFGITIATATLFSLFISFTLTPMLASRFLKHQSEHSRNPLAVFGRYWEAGYNRLARLYRRVLNRALSRIGRPLVVLAAALTLFAAFQMLALNLVGSEYVPQEDDGQFTVSLTTPPGTSLAGNRRGGTRRSKIDLLKLPEVQRVFTSVGGWRWQLQTPATPISPSSSKTSRSVNARSPRCWATSGAGRGTSLTCRCGPASRIRSAAAVVPHSTFVWSATTSTRPDRPRGKVRDRHPHDAGAVDVNNDASQRDPELRAVLNRQRLSDLNVSASTVANALRTAVGGVVVTELKPEGSGPDRRARTGLRRRPG